MSAPNDGPVPCRYCGHGPDAHEDGGDPRPCNHVDRAARTHCTCYGYNYDFPDGRGPASSWTDEEVAETDKDRRDDWRRDG